MTTLGCFCRNCGRPIVKRNGEFNFRRTYCDGCRRELKASRLRRDRLLVVKAVRRCPEDDCPMRMIWGRTEAPGVGTARKDQRGQRGSVPLAQSILRGPTSDSGRVQDGPSDA